MWLEVDVGKASGNAPANAFEFFRLPVTGKFSCVHENMGVD